MIHPLRYVAHLAAVAAAAATISAPAYAQADRCAMFQSVADQLRCSSELSQSPQAVPYCLPMTGQQVRAVRSGQRVVVPGVDGCSQVWN